MELTNTYFQHRTPPSRPAARDPSRNVPAAESTSAKPCKWIFLCPYCHATVPQLTPRVLLVVSRAAARNGFSATTNATTSTPRGPQPSALSGPIQVNYDLAPLPLLPWISSVANHAQLTGTACAVYQSTDCSWGGSQTISNPGGDLNGGTDNYWAQFNDNVKSIKCWF